MKKISFACLMLVALLAAGCERQPTARAGGDHDLSFDRERQAYENHVEGRLQEFEHRFEGLEARLKGLDRKAHERLRVDIDELRARKDALEEKLNDLNKVSDHSWPEVKASLDRELGELETAYSLVSANNLN